MRLVVIVYCIILIIYNVLEVFFNKFGSLLIMSGDW